MICSPHTNTAVTKRVHNFTYEPTTNAKCNMKNMQPQPMANKSSAVAEMGDRLDTIGMGRKWGGAAVGGWVPI